MILLIFLGVLFLGIAIGLPVSYSLLLCGVTMMFELDMFSPMILSQNLLSGSDNFTFMAIPFFILAGELMNEGGLSRRIVDLPLKLIGHKPGGLGYVAIVATVIMASLSGSAVADTAAVAAILLPMMVQGGYKIHNASGLIAAGGIIAPIIPPSIPFIVFGVVSGVSISKLFFAGIVPGLIMGAGLLVVWRWQARRLDFTPQERASGREVWATLRTSVWALLMPVLVIGGFRFDIFTPTEAGAVAAVYALILGLFVYRELSWRRLPANFIASVKTVAVVMLLAASAQVTGYMMTLAELPYMLIEFLEPLLDSPRTLMLIMMILVFLAGLVMDLAPVILILTPVFMPLVEEANINPVYFGVIMVVNCSIGLITPPVGNVLNVITGIAKIPFEKSVVGVFPYLLCHIAVLALLMVFPQLVLVPLKFFFP